MKHVLCLLLLLSTSAKASEPTSTCASYAADLNTMVRVDQALRERIDYENLPNGNLKESELPRLFQQIAIVDRANEARLSRLVSICGWPRKSIYGAQAAGDAWLLAQHAEPKLQRSFLPLLQAAADAGEADPANLAYLADRVAIHEGRPQLYGTQLDQKGPCAFELSNLDDRAKVNERRKAAGMPSLEEYEAMFKTFLSTRGCPAQ